MSDEPPIDRDGTADDEARRHMRARPSMYVGCTTSRGRRELLWEVVANAFDQVLAGAATRADIALHADGSASVSDDGAGLPRRALEHFLRWHDSPTADRHAPHLHLTSGSGLGLMPVCAMSAWLEVSARRDDEPPLLARYVRGVAAGPAHVLPPRARRGTTVRLLPDPELFPWAPVPEGPWDDAVIATRLDELCSLFPGVALSLTRADGARSDVVRGDGLLPLLSRRTAHMGRRIGGPIEMEAEEGAHRARVALAWHDHDAPHFVGYACLLETREGGSHMAGLRRGLRLALRRHAGRAAREPLEAGLGAVVSVDVDDPSFSGPTRSRLDHDAAGRLVARLVAARLPEAIAGQPLLRRALELRREVALAPDDPGPRAVYVDWLVEQGLRSAGPMAWGLGTSPD